MTESGDALLNTTTAGESGHTDNTHTEDEKLEFFKLDKTDRKVLFWLMDNVKPNSIKSWIEYVAEEYNATKGIYIDTEKLYKETQGC